MWRAQHCPLVLLSCRLTLSEEEDKAYRVSAPTVGVRNNYGAKLTVCPRNPVGVWLFSEDEIHGQAIES